MNAALLMYDDERAHTFEPFVATRPICELLAGVCTVRERWEEKLGMRSDGFVGAAHLAEFEEDRAPAYFAGEIPANCIVANSRFLPALRDGRTTPFSPGGADIWLSQGRVTAVRLGEVLAARQLASGKPGLEQLRAAGVRSAEMDGVWIENVWDLIRYLPAQLSSDIGTVANSTGASVPKCAPQETIAPVRLREIAAVLGDAPVVVAADAIVDPYVVFDARGGPILVSRGVHINSFSRIEGPCYLGPECTVMAGRIATCAIGEKSRVCGEMSNSVVLGFSNKAHDGFIGHSYLGRWVNIGAGSITSNLKNTYGSVSLWTPSGMRETGMQFLGTMFGDHARTGIGTMLSTGSVLGVGANVFGGEMPPRYVPPFSWGRGSALEDYQFEKFLEVAERVMSRRQVTLTDGVKRHYAEVRRAARK